jgi:hypothetical protein
MVVSLGAFQAWRFATLVELRPCSEMHYVACQKGTLMKSALIAINCLLAMPALAETRSVFLEDQDGQRIEIATLQIGADSAYTVKMAEEPFADHFLSMRPFKCLEGPAKHWCHVPYPYEIERNISEDLTDLEYDFLFVWKDANEYGINMWNGVYYQIEQTGGTLTGTLHDMDMDTLSVPPAAGELRPVAAKHLHESDPDSHWLPRIVIE